MHGEREQGSFDLWLECTQTVCLGKKILVKTNYFGGMETRDKNMVQREEKGQEEACGTWSWKK